MKLQFSALMMVLVVFASAQLVDYYVPYKKTDVARTGMKGNVKSVFQTEWSMVEKFGDPVKNAIKNKKEEYYYKSGNYEKRNTDTSKKGIYVYIYKNGRLEEVKRVPIEDNVDRTFLYDSNNRLIERNLVYRNNKLFEKDKYKYDSNGVLLSIHKYNGDGTLKGKKTFEWDEKSNIVEEFEYDSKEEPLTMESYEYDSKGNLINYDILTKGSEETPKIENYTHKYDSQNLRISSTKEIEDGMHYFLYENDANGNRINYKYKSPKQNNYKIRNENIYTYDNMGNWTKLLNISYDDKGGKTYELTEREIKYW